MLGLGYICAITLFLSLCFSTTAAPPLTNGERLARGLPPSQPKGWVTRNIGGASRTVPGDMKRPRWNGKPSGVPSHCLTGYIQVTRTDTWKQLGFIQKTFSAVGLYVLTPTNNEIPQGLLVTFCPPANNVPFTITALNNPKQNLFPFLGELIGPNSSNDGNLATGSSEFVLLGGAKLTTPPLSKPQDVGNSYAVTDKGTETSIWTYNTQTQELKPTWINEASGQPATTAVSFWSTALYFGITGDLTQFNKAFPSATAYPIMYTFVSI